MNPHDGNCISCIKFRKECPNGVMEDPEHTQWWDGHDGGCSLWMDKGCIKCAHIKTGNGTRCSKIVCGIDIGWMDKFGNDGRCTGFTPKVSQTTLEGFR